MKMANYKAVSTVFVILTMIFAAATVYLTAYPSTSTATTTQVSTATKTVTAPTPQYTVNIAYKAGIGFYLTNATGFTLYFRSTDTPNSGNTTCTTAFCEKSWPVFYTPTISIPPGLNSSSFGTITAYNSTKITTYDGYPLFYWASDSTPGSTAGQGVGNFYVCTVPTPAKPA